MANVMSQYKAERCIRHAQRPTISWIHAAAKMSAKKSCTNVLIKCEFCSDVHWKYNIHWHLQERHGSWEQRSDHTKFREKITISPVEEERLGIPDDLVGCSVTRHLNYDAARMDCLPTIHDLHDESPRQARTQLIYNPAPVPFALPAYVHYRSYVQPQTDVTC
jgi:hypothetical protein